MPLQNLPENQLFRDLPQALINLDKRDIITAITGGMQDRNEDLRTFISKYGLLYSAIANTPETGVNAVQVVYTTDVTGATVSRSVNITSTTPDSPTDLINWASAEISIPVDQIVSATKITDPFRIVQANTLSYLADSVGCVLFPTTATTMAEVLKDNQRILEGYFPRLRIKGTALSFELLGRLVGWSDAKFTPLWGRLSPRLAADVGNAVNDNDFNSNPVVYPAAQLPSDVYDPFQYRDGEVFYEYHSSFNPVTNSFSLNPLSIDPASTDFFEVRINGQQPFIKITQTGETVTAPFAGKFPLHGGEPFKKSSVDLLNGITVFALAEGDGFNGLVVELITTTNFMVDTGTNQIHTDIPHGLVTGDLREVNTTGTLPGGLNLAVTYGVRVLDSTTITLHPSRADALAGTRVMDLTSDGIGLQSILLGGSVIRVLDKLSSIKYRTSYYDLALTMTPELIDRLYCSPSVTPNAFLAGGNLPQGDNTLGPALSPFRPFTGGVRGGVFNPYTTLTSGTTLAIPMDGVVTTANVVNATGFPAVGTISIDSEFMDYTSHNATQFLGLTRGAHGTIAASHPVFALVQIPRLQVNSSSATKQLDMDSVQRFGARTFHDYEEVRPATRFPRRELTGLLLEDTAIYAAFQAKEDLFTTDGSTTFFSAAPTGFPEAPYNAVFLSDDGTNLILLVGETNPATPGILNLKGQFINPLQTLSGTYNFNTNTYSFTLNAAAAATVGVVIRALYSPLSTEIVRTEPVNLIKVLDEQGYQTRPEDADPDQYPFLCVPSTASGDADGFGEAVFGDSDDVTAAPALSCTTRQTGMIQLFDEYPWRRGLDGGGGDVVDDNIYIASDTGIEPDYGKIPFQQAATLFDESGEEYKVIVLDTEKPVQDDFCLQDKSTSNTPSSPVNFYLDGLGEKKPLPMRVKLVPVITSLETTLEPLFTRSPVAVGSQLTCDDINRRLFTIGVVNGVLCANPDSFFPNALRTGLVGWLPFNEHPLDNLFVTDHSRFALGISHEYSVTSGLASINSVVTGFISNIAPDNRVFDPVKGWNLRMSENRYVAMEQYREVSQEFSFGFWLKTGAVVAESALIIQYGGMTIELSNPQQLRVFLENDNSTRTLVSTMTLDATRWNYVLVRMFPKTATMRIVTTGLGQRELAGPLAYATFPQILSGNDIRDFTPDDEILKFQSFSRTYQIHDVRIWNRAISDAEQNMAFLPPYTQAITEYHPSFVFNQSATEKYGFTVLDEGWVYPQSFYLTFDNESLAQVQRYDGNGNYTGEGRYKQVGLGGGRQLPATFALGRQGYDVNGEGQTVVSTYDGVFPGFNDILNSASTPEAWNDIAPPGFIPTETPPLIAGVGYTNGANAVTATPWPMPQEATNPCWDRLYCMGEPEGDDIKTTLTVPMNMVVTTADVVTTAGFPDSGTILIDMELIDYTSHNATQFLGLTRGTHGTMAGNHLVSAIVKRTRQYMYELMLTRTATTCSPVTVPPCDPTFISRKVFHTIEIAESQIHFTVDIDTNEIIGERNLPLETGAARVVTTTGTLPSPLLPATVYYLRVTSLSRATLHATLADANSGLNIINLTTTGIGVQTLELQSVLKTPYQPTDAAVLLTSSITNGDKIMRVKTVGGGTPYPYAAAAAGLFDYDSPPAYLYLSKVGVFDLNQAATYTRWNEKGNCADSNVVATRKSNGILSFNNPETLCAGRYRLTMVVGNIGTLDDDFHGFDVEITVGTATPVVIPAILLPDGKGTNPTGTSVIEFTTETGTGGNPWNLSVLWKNDLDIPSRGQTRQLAIYGMTLEERVSELYGITLDAGCSDGLKKEKQDLTQADVLLGSSHVGTVNPGGWRVKINSRGVVIPPGDDVDRTTSHESLIYPFTTFFDSKGNALTQKSPRPLSDLLTGSTESRREDLIISSFLTPDDVPDLPPPPIGCSALVTGTPFGCTVTVSYDELLGTFDELPGTLDGLGRRPCSIATGCDDGSGAVFITDNEGDCLVDELGNPIVV